jgi:sugar transferase EpsL
MQTKRVFDLIVVLLMSPFLLPVTLVIYILIKFTIGKPVLFIQERPGYLGEPFRMYKYRTMTNERDKAGKLLPDNMRLTRVGKVLRNSSLDELPEIINVLKGDMSLVGPRPLLMQYLERYTPEQMRRHEVKPGITGWAQVNGRNALSWEEKFKLDIWYVENQSLWLDVKIMILTIVKVFCRYGISSDRHATMEEFMGIDSEKKGNYISNEISKRD